MQYVNGIFVNKGQRIVCLYNDKHREGVIDKIFQTRNLGEYITVKTAIGFRTFDVNKIRGLEVIG